MLIKTTALIAIFFLVACGGGGGGVGGGGGAVITGGGGGGAISQWSVTTAQANTYRTTEYNNQNGLEQIHAAEAYAALEKNSKPVAGDGVKIGIVDSGIQTNHVDLAANYISSGSRDYVNSDSDPMDDYGHGSHVASIAAAAKNDSGMYGVAYNSNILAEKALDSSGNGFESDVASGIENASNNGAKIINLSLGGGADTGVKSALLTAKSANALTVAAAGNSGNSAQPDYPARYASDASLTGYVLAVVAVNSSSTIAGFSSLCGDAKDYCLAAPGVSIYGASSDTNSIGGSGLNGAKYVTINGTSMATPHVAGAAAVLRAAWPILTAPQVAQILLTTATDLGATGVDTTYGHGLLNLYAAVQAQGQNILGYGANIYSGGYDVNSSSISGSSIFGDAFASNVAPQLNDAVFFDDYGRDYKAFLGNKITSQNNNSLNLSGILLNNFQTKSVPLRFGFEGRNNFKFNYTDYRNSAQNFSRIDKSQDPQSGLRQGFSFTRNSSDITPNLKFGFSVNVDEISANNQKEFGNFGFISQNNLGENPYQSFLQNNQQRNFNQLFAKKDFFANKFSLNFSYQSSYNSEQILQNFSQKQNQITDVSFAFKPEKFGNYLVSFGNLTEFDNNLLNSKSLGAFETAGNVKTSYVKFSTNHELFKNLFLISSYSEGISKIPGNSQGIFRSFNNVKSRSASIGLVCEKIFNGKVGVNYLEPMRVYRGSVDINIPTGIDVNGNLIRYQTTASLAPKGKEQDLDFFYSRNLNTDSQIKFNLIVQKNAGNNFNAATNYLGMVQYSLTR